MLGGGRVIAFVWRVRPVGTLEGKPNSEARTDAFFKTSRVIGRGPGVWPLKFGLH